MKGHLRIIIVDEDALRWYWIGKAPKTKIAFTEWINGPESAGYYEEKHDLHFPLSKISYDLHKKGIIKRVRVE